MGLRGFVLGLRELILGLLWLILGLRGAAGGLDIRMYGCTDVQTDVWTYGHTDIHTDGCLEIHPCVLQDIGPLGLLPEKCVDIYCV